MHITRALKQQIQDLLNNNRRKVIILYGARQVGKTTLVKEIMGQFQGNILEVNADITPFIEPLSSRDLQQLKAMVAGYDLLIIDEAQRIPDIGINLKILYDHLAPLKIIVTGSSSLDLANRVQEPLTGRTHTMQLFPIAVYELHTQFGFSQFEASQKLEEWMVYGMYPELLSLSTHQDKVRYLYELTQSYLYKDILTLAQVKYPEKLRQLLKLLAWQTGSLVSTNELAGTLQISRDAVTNYIDLLEKAFVIFRLGGFSRNLRKEMTKMNKYYFYDLGIRNALINNFNRLSGRQDIGQLWESFLITERLKTNHYLGRFGSSYFWRTQTGAEIDYLEESDGFLSGRELKWVSTARKKPPVSWSEAYPSAGYSIIHRENFLDFVLGR